MKKDEKPVKWCSYCKGRGYIITHQKDKNTCEHCRGTGLLSKSGSSYSLIIKELKP